MYVCFVFQASEDLLREHYWELRSKPFFKGLMSYMSSGPIVAMVRFSYKLYMCPQDTKGPQKFIRLLVWLITHIISQFTIKSCWCFMVL